MISGPGVVQNDGVRTTCGMIDVSRDHVCYRIARETRGTRDRAYSSLLVAIQAAPARRFGVPGYAAGFRSRGNDGSMACDVMFRLAVMRRNVASDSASRMGLDDWHDRVDQALQFVGTDG